MGKGKVIGTVAAAVVIPAAAVVGAIYILPLLNITSSNTLYYFGNDASVAADGARRKCLATARNTPTL